MNELITCAPTQNAFMHIKAFNTRIKRRSLFYLHATSLCILGTDRQNDKPMTTRIDLLARSNTLD